MVIGVLPVLSISPSDPAGCRFRVGLANLKIV